MFVLSSRRWRATRRLWTISAQTVKIAPGFVGLDQINAVAPRALAGRGDVEIELIADGKRANEVRVSFK